MVSLEASKTELKKIYQQETRTKTLHCECYFDKILQVFPNICEQGARTPGSKKKVEFLQWIHGVPVSQLGNALKCWSSPVCSGSGNSIEKKARCCGQVSPKFKAREADMHNLFPGVRVGSTGSSIAANASIFGGMEEYRFCMKKNKPPLEPRPGVRGNLARAYFYMAFQYKFPIGDELEDKLRMWHLNDPPDEWEEKRNTLIEIVQGNRNPFIDNPELVERVRNF